MSECIYDYDRKVFFLSPELRTFQENIKKCHAVAELSVCELCTEDEDVGFLFPILDTFRPVDNVIVKFAIMKNDDTFMWKWAKSVEKIQDSSFSKRENESEVSCCTERSLLLVESAWNAAYTDCEQLITRLKQQIITFHEVDVEDLFQQQVPAQYRKSIINLNQAVEKCAEVTVEKLAEYVPNCEMRMLPERIETCDDDKWVTQGTERIVWWASVKRDIEQTVGKVLEILTNLEVCTENFGDILAFSSEVCKNSCTYRCIYFRK